MIIRNSTRANRAMIQLARKLNHPRCRAVTGQQAFSTFNPAHTACKNEILYLELSGNGWFR